MSCISELNPDTLVILGAFLAVLVSQNLSNDEINVLGNFLTQIGAVLLTKAAQQQSIQSQEDLKKQISDMEDQLAKLKKQVCR